MIPLPAQVYRHLVLHCKEGLRELQQQSGVQRMGLDVVGKGLQVTGTAGAVAAAEGLAFGLLDKYNGDGGVVQAARGREVREGGTGLGDGLQREAGLVVQNAADGAGAGGVGMLAAGGERLEEVECPVCRSVRFGDRMGFV